MRSNTLTRVSNNPGAVHRQTKDRESPLLFAPLEACIPHQRLQIISRLHRPSTRESEYIGFGRSHPVFILKGSAPYIANPPADTQDEPRIDGFGSKLDDHAVNIIPFQLIKRTFGDPLTAPKLNHSIRNLSRFSHRRDRETGFCPSATAGCHDFEMIAKARAQTILKFLIVFISGRLFHGARKQAPISPRTILLSGISHINLLGWFPVPFPDENQLIPFRWVCQEPSNPPQQGADGHRLPQKADPRPSVPFVRGSTR